MTFNHQRSAWVLTGLQLALSLFFYFNLKTVLPPVLAEASFMATPNWFITLNVLNFGLTIILGLCALWRFRITGLVLLLAMHIICPLLFFTDLTRNPYFTQITLFNIWISFIWISWLAESLQRKVFIFPRTALNLPFFAFLAVATLSWGLSFFQHADYLHSPMIWEGLRNWVFLVMNVMAVFYVAYTIDEKWQKRFLWVTFCVAGVAAIYGLMQFYGVERIWQKTLTPFANRPVSTFGNPNFLSSYLLLVIPPLTVSTMISKNTVRSVISLALLVVVVAGLIATMTRSTWVGAFVAVVLLPIAPPVRQIIRKNKMKFYVFGAIVLCSVIFWPKSKLGGYSNPWDRLIELKEIGTGKRYHPWSQRILIWSCSFMMMKDHPLLGKGWGLMELFYPYYQGKMLFHPVLGEFRTHANNSHNEVFEIWSQTGTIGMGIYVWLWIIIVGFGLKLARSSSAQAPPSTRAPPDSTQSEKAIWGWAFAAAALGMLVDNFFGNVSLHFCVPAFLFWWQAGLLFGMKKNPLKKIDQESALDYYFIPVSAHARMSVICLGILFFTSTAAFAFRKEFQEIFYFNGFKITKAPNAPLDLARQQLEKAWLWFPREVNSNYELSNTYARMSQEANKQGLSSVSDTFRQKAIWAYSESLRSNAGYDEIFFNLAATLSLTSWHEDVDKSFEVERPDGKKITESIQKIGGAITNFSRALRINPMSQEGYNYLGNTFLQNRSKYLKEADLLFEQGTKFYPQNKDLWVNLAFVRIEENKMDEALNYLQKAMNLDPFYEISRKNIRAIIAKTKNYNHPLARVDRILGQVNGWIDSKSWPALKQNMEYTSEVLPESATVWLVLANVYFETRVWDKAENAYLKALEFDYRNITAANNLALAYQLQGKTTQARSAFERVLKIQPGHPEAKKALESFSKS